MKNKLRKNGLRPEYNFHALKGAVRGKYAKQYRAGTNLVHLEPDVARVFATDQLVNETLRSLMRLAKNRAAHDR
jgi:hypothetical protein